MDPIKIISNNTYYKEEHLLVRFINVITHLYQYSIFKDILDLVATKAYDNHLKFKISDMTKFDLNEGNCMTIFPDDFLDKMRNKIMSEKKYLINIKKITGEVIIHEIAHMVYNDTEDKLNPQNFMNAITEDISNIDTKNVSLKDAVRNVCVKEVAQYPKEQHIPELFARYFQMIAGTHEITRYGASYAYNMNEVERVFKITYIFITKQLNTMLKNKINNVIADVSRNYIKNVSEIKHRWTGEKIQSFHGAEQINKSSNDSSTDLVKKSTKTWTKSIKSIGDTQN